MTKRLSVQAREAVNRLRPPASLVDRLRGTQRWDRSAMEELARAVSYVVRWDQRFSSNCASPMPEEVGWIASQLSSASERLPEGTADSL